MLTDVIKHLKELFKNSLPEIFDAYKAGLVREAIILLNKAEKLSVRDGDRNEINRLIATALIWGDEAGVLNEKLNRIQTQIQRRGNKAFQAGEKH